MRKSNVIRELRIRRNAYYLVEQEGKQIMVTLTENFIESKLMAKEIVGDKFEIGDYRFQKTKFKVEK